MMPAFRSFAFLYYSINFAGKIDTSLMIASYRLVVCVAHSMLFNRSGYESVICSCIPAHENCFTEIYAIHKVFILRKFLPYSPNISREKHFTDFRDLRVTSKFLSCTLCFCNQRNIYHKMLKAMNPQNLITRALHFAHVLGIWFLLVSQQRSVYPQHLRQSTLWLDPLAAQRFRRYLLNRRYLLKLSEGPRKNRNVTTEQFGTTTYVITQNGQRTEPVQRTWSRYCIPAE